MEHHNELELIEKYLCGELKGSLFQEFEDRMASDQDFSARVDNYRIAMKSAEVFGKTELKNKLRKIHREEINVSVLFSRRQILKLAAVFIGLLIVSGPFVYNFFFGQPNYQNLFEQNFTIYPDILSMRGESQPENLMLDEAMSYYKNNDFENASALFGKIDHDNPAGDETVRFYCGISYLGTGHPEKAAEIFKKIVGVQSNPFAEQAAWYLALSYISQEKPDEAKLLLEEIVNQKSWNHAKASLLLKKID